MAKSRTPFADLVERLLSTQMSTPDIVAAVRAAEEAATIARGGTPDERKRWAEQKARQRGMSTGQRAVGLDSRTAESQQVGRKKKPAARVHVDIPADDGWPADFLEQFWRAFPPYRRQAKAKVGLKLERLRRDKVVGWEPLMVAVRRFAGTDPGIYAPAPIVWLNDGRWDREYGTQGGTNEAARIAGGGGARVGFSGLAARLRRSVEGSDAELSLGGEPPGGSERRD